MPPLKPREGPRKMFCRISVERESARWSEAREGCTRSSKILMHRVDCRGHPGPNTAVDSNEVGITKENGTGQEEMSNAG